MLTLYLPLQENESIKSFHFRKDKGELFVSREYKEFNPDQSCPLEFTKASITSGNEPDLLI